MIQFSKLTVAERIKWDKRYKQALKRYMTTWLKEHNTQEFPGTESIKFREAFCQKHGLIIGGVLSGKRT